MEGRENKSEEECERQKNKGKRMGARVEKSGRRKRVGDQRRQRKQSGTCFEYLIFINHTTILRKLA